MMASVLVDRRRWAVFLLVLQLGWGTQLATAQGAQQASSTAITSDSSASTSAGKNVPAPTTDIPETTDTKPAANPKATGAATEEDAKVLSAVCRRDSETPPRSPKLARVQGVISAPDEGPPNIVLTLIEKSTSNHYEIGSGQLRSCNDNKDPERFAYWIEVPPGKYDLNLAGRHYESRSMSDISLGANDVKQQNFYLVKEESPAKFIWLPAVFLISMWLIRWNNIAKPSRFGVIAQIESMKRRLPSDSVIAPGLDDAKNGLQSERPWLDWLFWSRGQEMASWSLIHEAELALLESADLDKINARLASAEQRLSEIDQATAKSLADRIRAEFTCDASKVNKEARRQLLIEATRYIFDVRDADFGALTSWQNKAFWLTFVGLILIWVVGITQDHAALFLAGAVGGFFSRLSRQLKRADVPVDYGASWATLFLSPVAGAISGWFGIALIMWLSDPSIGLLGGPLKSVRWDSPNVAAMLAAAFVLGFSERLFDGIVSQLEGSIDKKKEDAQKATTRSPSEPHTNKDDSAKTPGILSLSPNPAPPGGEVSAQLANLDASKVTSVVLVAASGDKQALNPRAENSQLKFSVAADTAPGTYKIALLAPDRIETDKSLTVSHA